MDIIQKNGKTIAIIAGVAAVAAGVALLFRKAGKEDHIDITSLGGHGLTEAQKAVLLAKVNVAYNQGYLTFQSISQICDATLEIAAPTFVLLTRKDRKERRNNRNDLARYISLWNEYAAVLEELIETSQKEVLERLNVSAHVWEASNSFFMQQGNQELLMLHASLPQKLKMSLGSSRELNNQEFKEILGAQIELLNREADHAEEIIPLIDRPEEIAPIIQNRVNDEIFDKFGIEEEDIFRSMRGHIMDPEVQQLFMQLQMVTMKMLPQQPGMGF